MVSMGAAVAVGNATIAGSWDGSNLLALDGLEITWGRTDPYDETEPGTLKATIIDPSGAWASDQSLNGQPITVYRTGATSTVMFRGTISKATAERRRVYDPSTRSRVPVWVADIVAADTLGTAAASVLPGEMGDGSVEGLGGWGESQPETFIPLVLSRGGNRVFDTAEVIADRPESNLRRRIHGRPAADQVSLLDLIAQTYRTVPLGVVNYDPAANGVKVGSFAVASNIVLVYSSQRVAIQMPSGRAIDAARVLTPDGYRVETTTAEAIDVVQLNYWWYGKDAAMSSGSQKRVTYTQPLIQQETARAATSGTRRLLKLDSELIYRDPTEFADGIVDDSNRTPAWLLGQIVSIVNTINGQLRLPKLRFDHERVPLDAATTDVIYAPYQSSTPLYFIGSIFNQLANAGPQFQIIGGTLRYERGWRHDVAVIAARRSTPTELTLAALFGSSDAAWGEFDPTISLGDLSTITQGLT